MLNNILIGCLLIIITTLIHTIITRIVFTIVQKKQNVLSRLRQSLGCAE